MALKVMNDGAESIGAERDGALYYFRAKGDYIFKGIGNEFAASYSNKSRLVTILSGEGVCCGRHVTEKKIGSANSQITLPANTSGYLSIRVSPEHDPDTRLVTAAAVQNYNINDFVISGHAHDLPLYAFVTNSNSITSFVDIRPIYKGNSFFFREEDGELYAIYIKNGKTVRKKIVTKEVTP